MQVQECWERSVIMNINNINDKYLKPLVDGIVSLKIDINKIILFGSFAKNTAKVGSDIDLAIVSEKLLSPMDRGQIICLPDEIGIDFPIDFYFTLEEYLKEPQGVFNPNANIKKEGVVLWQQ